MSVDVPLPETLAREVRALVDAGEYPDLATAVADLVRLGLLSRERPFRPSPGRPPMPPGRRDPGDDRPIEIRPDDVNWM
ncbi:MAG TPA: hypothetical protein VM889_09530 [Candidatus Thermoplasmatota archaeon]|nr:hypothetical protein [Candidatus Thermoplasmatota archaeon]